MPIPEFETGEFLKPKNVRTGEFLKFINGGEWKVSVFKKGTTEENSKKQLEILVMHNNEEKKFTLNSPSYEALSPAYGEDTDNWVGKSAMITIKQYQGFNDGIVLMPCITAPTETPTAPKAEDVAWDE